MKEILKEYSNKLDGRCFGPCEVKEAERERCYLLACCCNVVLISDQEGRIADFE